MGSSRPNRTPANTRFTGKPCKRGHVAERYLKSGECVECALLKASAWYDANRPTVLARRKQEYERDPEAKRLAVKEHAATFPVQKKARRKADYDRNAARYRAQAASWASRNADRVRRNVRDWCKRNPDRCLHYKQLTRTERLKRRPKWLTAEHRTSTRHFYADARRLTRETGVLHHVDHIVPLQGRNVSGLHVPWNLQVIRAYDNLRKSNRMSADVA